MRLSNPTTGATPHYQPSLRIVPTHYDITVVCPHPEKATFDGVNVLTLEGKYVPFSWRR